MNEHVLRPGDDDMLAEMLTSQDAVGRCLARAVAAGIGEQVQAWIGAEIARDTEQATLLMAVAHLGLQHFANVAAYTLKPSGDEIAQEMILHIAQSRLPGYIATIRNAKGGAR